MRRRDPGVLVGAAVLAFTGVWAAFEAWGYGLWRGRAPGEGLYPLIVALALVVLAISCLFVESKSGVEAGPLFAAGQDAGEDTGPPQWRKIGLYLAGLIALAAFLPALGYWVVTVAVLVLILRGAERLSWRLTLSVTAASSVITYLVFERGLGLPLPRGPWL
jgi:putative tricarboxylic transport membrane protein